MKKNKTVSRITVNTAYSKHKPKRVDKGDKSLGSCWREWLKKHQGRVTWMIIFWNSQPAELFVQRSPFVMLQRTDVCRQEWPSSSRLCANFITISVEPLLHTPLFYRNPALLRVHVIGRSEAQTSKRVVMFEEEVIRGRVQKANLKMWGICTGCNMCEVLPSRCFWKLWCFGAFYRFRWQDYLSHLQRICPHLLFDTLTETKAWTKSSSCVWFSINKISCQISGWPPVVKVHHLIKILIFQSSVQRSSACDWLTTFTRIYSRIKVQRNNSTGRSEWSHQLRLVFPGRSRLSIQIEKWTYD